MSDILDELEFYESSHSGEDIDRGIDNLINMATFINRNLAIPYSMYAGNTTTQQLTNTSADMWLRGFVVKCVTPLPDDALDIVYDIRLGTTVLVEIPSAVMTTAGACVYFPVERVLPANSVCHLNASAAASSIGEIDIKVVMG